MEWKSKSIRQPGSMHAFPQGGEDVNGHLHTPGALTRNRARRQETDQVRPKTPYRKQGQPSQPGYDPENCSLFFPARPGPQPSIRAAWRPRAFSSQLLNRQLKHPSDFGLFSAETSLRSAKKSRWKNLCDGTRPLRTVCLPSVGSLFPICSASPLAPICASRCHRQ
jgi:hypothetical protein